jgi:NAD(P)-dependent dehydrogenase (short-subunit alcohol dehydrogenase family)
MPLSSSPRSVITGAGSGLGRAFALELAGRGSRMVLADTNLEGAEETANLVRERGGFAVVVRCDVAVADDVQALPRLAEEALGGCDLVINNAGVAAAGPVESIPLEDWRWTVDVDLWGVIHGCRAFLPRFKAAGAGHILNVASAAGLLCAPEMGPYNVAKAGVIALSETLAGELSGTGVGVTVLCPTFFRTNILRSSRSHGARGEELIEALMDRATLQAEGVARVALEACAADKLYVVPHEDGRSLWRMKRLSPEQYQRNVVPRLLGLADTLKTLPIADVLRKIRSFTNG